MGFNSVYKALQDVFPQVDSRILRAVAIEHSKDADIAVEVVLTEVIPNLPEQALAVTSFNKTENSPTISQVVVDKGKTVQLDASTVSPSATVANSETNNDDEDMLDVIGKKIALFSETFEDESVTTGFIQQQPFSYFANIPEPQLPLTQEQDPVSSSKSMPENNNNDFVMEENTEGESMMTSVLTKSDQICSTELLEEIIEDARNEKKTLVSTMESVTELMREVEEKEKAAEEAKEEANRDCSHILAQVDDLKQTLGRAKEANDMHAGEVYAEKAILATELKELQLRLFTLSDERNKSLAILAEMREALEIRLAAALKEIEAADEQKIEKQKYAKEALAFQESQLEKVVEESKKLKQEAEENSKLQEFLMDRGRAIDILQGEISVKCQDVRLLKEKFDKRIPLSRSLSSSQTSSILSASPTPSFRRTATFYEAEHETYGTPKKTSLELDDSYGVVDKSGAQSPKSPRTTQSMHRVPVDEGFQSGGQVKQSDAWKLLLNDDDWELFDKGELSTGA